jgi:hypothetical protein
VDVVEVDHAVRRDAVAFGLERQLSDESAPASGERRHDDGAGAVGDGIAGQHGAPAGHRQVCSRAQISPRRIGPVGPLLGGPPVGDLIESSLRVGRRL